MTVDQAPGNTVTPAADTGPSPLERIGLLFTHPGAAWEGLETRAQWWMPFLGVLVLTVGLVLVTYHNALLPTILERYDGMVADGKISSEQVDKMSAFFDSPGGMAMIIGQQAVAASALYFLFAAVVMFGVSFLLGGRLRYRHALETVCWSGLISLPETLGTFVWAAFQHGFRGIHFSFAVLLPESDTPSRLQTGLAVLLDAVGPFRIWYLVVLIIGAARLGGVSRRSAAWTLGTLYVLIALIGAVIASTFAPGG